MKKVDISIKPAASPNDTSLSTNFFFPPSNTLDPMAPVSWKFNPYSVSEHIIWGLIVSPAGRPPCACELPGPPHLSRVFLLLCGGCNHTCPLVWPQCTCCAWVNVKLLYYGGLSNRFLFLQLSFFPVVFPEIADNQQSQSHQQGAYLSQSLLQQGIAPLSHDSETSALIEMRFFSPLCSLRALQ